MLPMYYTILRCIIQAQGPFWQTFSFTTVKVFVSILPWAYCSYKCRSNRLSLFYAACLRCCVDLVISPFPAASRVPLRVIIWCPLIVFSFPVFQWSGVPTEWWTHVQISQRHRRIRCGFHGTIQPGCLCWIPRMSWTISWRSQIHFMIVHATMRSWKCNDKALNIWGKYDVQFLFFIIPMFTCNIPAGYI